MQPGMTECSYPDLLYGETRIFSSTTRTVENSELFAKVDSTIFAAYNDL